MKTVSILCACACLSLVVGCKAKVGQTTGQLSSVSGSSDPAEDQMINQLKTNYAAQWRLSSDNVGGKIGTVRVGSGTCANTEIGSNNVTYDGLLTGEVQKNDVWSQGQLSNANLQCGSWARSSGGRKGIVTQVGSLELEVEVQFANPDDDHEAVVDLILRGYLANFVVPQNQPEIVRFATVFRRVDTMAHVSNRADGDYLKLRIVAPHQKGAKTAVGTIHIGSFGVLAMDSWFNKQGDAPTMNPKIFVLSNPDRETYLGGYNPNWIPFNHAVIEINTTNSK